MRAGTAQRLLTATALLLIGWQALALVMDSRGLIAGPFETGRWLLQNLPLVLRSLGRTLSNAAVGFLAGNLVAVVLAGLAAIWPALTGLVTSIALVVFCLPLIATGPILRVVMGPGEGPQIVLAALAVYYTTLIPLLTGLRAVPLAWLDLVRSHGRGRLAALVHVRARASLPYLFAGFQIAAPAAFLGAMVGEFTGAERGLGVLTIRYMRALDVPGLWGVAMLAAAVAMAAYALIGAAARLLLDHRPPVILAPLRPVQAGRGWTQALLVALAVLLLWWATIRLAGLNPFFAKGPLDVAEGLTLGPQAAQMRHDLGRALVQTAAFLLPGYLAGLLAGAGLAVALTLWPVSAAVVMPIALALRSIPIVTTAPLIVLVLGRGALGTITLVAVMVFFPALVACLHGLRQAPAQVLDLFRVYAAGPVSQMLHVRLPAMLPAFFASARMSVPAAVLAVTVVEWLTTGRGLGSLMALSASVSDYRMLWSAVVVVTLLSVACHAAVAAVERRVLRVFAPEQLLT